MNKQFTSITQFMIIVINQHTNTRHQTNYVILHVSWGPPPPHELTDPNHPVCVCQPPKYIKIHINNSRSLINYDNI